MKLREVASDSGLEAPPSPGSGELRDFGAGGFPAGWEAGLLEAALETGNQLPPGITGEAPVVEGFEIISRLGRGASSEVWLAEEVDPGRTVALKILHRSGTGEADEEILQREFRILARLVHPNLVVLYHGITTADGRLGLAMEWIDGWPLDEWLEQHPALTLDAKLNLFGGIVAGVAFLHDNGVIHRDLKPANVIVDPNGVARIVDFGLARLHQEEAGAGVDGGSTGVSGTLHFMAPEQAANGKGSRAMPVDVYALGLMLYRLLTGKWLRCRKGTPAETLAQVLQPVPVVLKECALPRDLKSILQQALEPDPARRYHHARELAADLGRFAAKQPVAARPHTLIYLTSTFLRRQARGSAVAGGLVLAGLGAAAWIYMQQRAVAERNDANLRHAYELTSFTLRQLRDQLRAVTPEEEMETLPDLSDTTTSGPAGTPTLPLNAGGELDLRYYQALLADLRAATAEGKVRYGPALKAIQPALNLYSTLSNEAPGDPRRLLDAAQARMTFARLLGRSGRVDAAGVEAQKVLKQIGRLAVWPGFDPAPLATLRFDALRLQAQQAHLTGDSGKAVRFNQEMLVAAGALPEGLLVNPESEPMPRLALAASDLATHALAAGSDVPAEIVEQVEQATRLCRAAHERKPESGPLTCGLVQCLHAGARLTLRRQPQAPLQPLFQEATALLAALPGGSNPVAMSLAWELSGTAVEWAENLLNSPDPKQASNALMAAHQFTTYLRRRGDGRDEVFVRRARLYHYQSLNESRGPNPEEGGRPACLAVQLLRPRQLLNPDRADLALLTAQALYQARKLADRPATRWNAESARHLDDLLEKLRATPDQLSPGQRQELALLK